MKCLVLALALAGCSTDTFTGADGSPGDAGGDGGGSGDARDDGVVGSDAGCAAGGACPANALCNAFDDAQPTFAPFANISQNGGSVAFESDLRVTCPNAVKALVPAAPSTASGPRAGIGDTFTLSVPSAVAHARVELDVILPKNPTGAATFLFLFANSDAANGIGLVWTGSWAVHDSVTNDDAPISPRTDTWNHVALDVTFAESGGAGSVSFTYVDTNGQVQNAKLSKSTLTSTLVSSMTFGAGVTPIGTTSGPMEMHLDDVVFSPF